MKKGAAIALTVWLVLSLTACSGGESPSELQTSLPESSPSQAAEPSSSESSASDLSSTASAGAAANGSNRLVVYFSYGENTRLPEGADASTTASIQIWNGETTGNTGVVAHMIADATGADLFSIRTAEKYPDSYDATVDQGQQEKNNGARPELSSHLEDLDRYDVIFLGYPNWWSDMPMAVYSFLEEVDLSGKTVVPFVTSGGSGFSGTVSTIQNLEPGATLQNGISIHASNAADAQAQIKEWLSGLGYES